MPNPFETLASFAVFRYLRPQRDSLAFLAWVLSQPQENVEKALGLLHQLFQYHGPETEAGRQHPKLVYQNFLIRLTPTDVVLAPLDLMRLTVQVDEQLADLSTWAAPADLWPFDNGYYVLAQFGNDVLVLLANFSWWPVKLPEPPPAISPAWGRLHASFIFIEVANDETVSLEPQWGSYRGRWGETRVSVAYEEISYGPHTAVAVVAGPLEQAGEMLSELKEQDPRWADERAEILSDVRDDHGLEVDADTDDATYNAYHERLHENDRWDETTLPTWEAAAFLVQETLTLSGIEDIEVVDGEAVLESNKGTLVAFVNNNWVAFKPGLQPGHAPGLDRFPSRLGDRPALDTTGHAGYVPNWVRLELSREPHRHPEPVVRAPEYVVDIFPEDRVQVLRSGDRTVRRFYYEADAESAGETWIDEHGDNYEEVRYEVRRVK
jgi:hypothetical protein